MTVSFCKSSKINSNIDLTIYSSIDDVPKDKWAVVQEKYDNVYLSPDYLKAVESGLTEMMFNYVLYEENNEVIGIAYSQIIHISNREINTKALSAKLGGLVPKHLVESINLKILICGNAFATGENGFQFLPQYQEESYGLINEFLSQVKAEKREQGHKISIVMVKEFWPETFKAASNLKKNSFSEVAIDVNMVVHLDQEWKTFDDYLAALNSKFRTKAKSVMKKSKDITIVDFDSSNADQFLDKVDELYNPLVDKANFSFGRLNATTLFNMKRSLNDCFVFKGYFLGERLIGFSTATAISKALDGNYIGLDYEFNQQYSLYQRMLYDFIKHAIECGLTEIRIGRTAEEIKSGVGAEPVEMKFYAKHRNSITNTLLRPIVQKLEPSKFEQRKPFKASHYS